MQSLIMTPKPKTTMNRPYISHLTLTNIKAAPKFDLELSPLTLIHGPNGQGKSAIADGLALGLLGYHPSLGKSGPAIQKLAGPGKEFGSMVNFSDGTRISRSWKRTKTGASKLPGSDASPPIDLASLDPSAFLGAKDAKRAAMIAARYGIEGDPKAAILAKVRAALGTFDFIPPNEEDFSAWAEQIEEVLADKRKEAGAIKRRMTATLEGMTTLDTAPPPRVSREAIEAARTAKAGLAARIQELNSKALAVNREISSLPEGYPVREGRTEAELREALARIEKEIAPLEEAYRAYQQAEALRSSIVSAITKKGQSLKTRRLWLDENGIQAEWHPEWMGENQSLPYWKEIFDKQISNLEKQVVTANRTLVTAAGTVKAAQDNALTGAECPCCGAVRAVWDAQKIWDSEEALVAAQAGHAEAEKALADLESEIHISRTRKAEVESLLAIVAANAQRMAAQSEYDREVAELAEQQEQLGHLPCWEHEQQEDLDALREEERVIGEELADIAREAEAVKGHEKRRTLEGQLDELQIERDRANIESEAAIEALAELEKAQAEVDAATARAAEVEKARKEAAAAAQEETIWDSALEIHRKECNAETVKVFKPLLDFARQITDGCLPTPLDNNGLTLGRFDGAHFITLDTFSGSEKAVALAGIVTALAATGSGLVMIDEFSTFDDAKKGRFVDNLAAAIERGDIAQAVLLDSRNFPGEMPPVGSVVCLG